MKYLFLILIVSSPTHATEMSMKVGEERTIQLPKGGELRLSGKKHIHVKELASGIKITALKTGKAEIHHSSGINYFIRVKRQLSSPWKVALLNLFKNFKGLKLNIDKNSVRITGKLHRFDDWLSLTHWHHKHNKTYQFLAEPDKDIRDSIEKYLRQYLLAQALAEPLWQWKPKPKARLPTEAQKYAKNYDEVLSPFGLLVEYDESQVHLKPLVRVKILVAEVSKNFSQDLGIKWPQSMSAQLSPRFDATNPITAALNIAETQGEAHILASPQLLARSGGKAEFLAGGEFPIRIVSRRMKDVVWKKHGVLLKIQPEADLLGRIKLKLTTEVSMMSNGAKDQIEGLPQMKTSRIQSEFDMIGGKTIILSGLIQNSLSDSAEGIAGLRGIPILGRLFESQKYQRDETELIIFVSPEVLSPQHTERVQLPRGMRKND